MKRLDRRTGQRHSTDSRPPLATVLISVLAGLKVAVHVVTNVVTPYSFHRDEFLYLAMGRHLELWKMDFPPAIAILAEAMRAMLGDSLVAIRLGPALAGAALVVLAALIARELGGGRFAQGLAGLAVLGNTLFLRAANLFQPVVLDQLWWTLGLYALVRLSRTAEPRWWIALGLAGGFGLLTKFSVLIFGLGVLVAVLVTPLRRTLATRWPWLALLLTLAIGSPSVVGQIHLHFPLLLQMADLRQAQLARVTPGEFLIVQLLLGPTTLVAVVGLVGLLRDGQLRPFRAVAWVACAVTAALLALHGKPYYLGPVYPALYGAGAVVIQRVRHPRLGSALRWAAAVLIVLYGGVVLLPLGLPILPPEAMARYGAAIGVTPALRTNRGELERLPQDYADMLGWEEQVRAIARVYDSLPAAERAQTVIVAGNYGEAGAIDFFGPRYGLPHAVSPAGTYWLFGPGDKPGNVVIAIGVSRNDLLQFFDSVTAAAHVGHPFAVAEERQLTICVAKRPRRTLQEVWPSLAGRYS